MPAHFGQSTMGTLEKGARQESDIFKEKCARTVLWLALGLAF